MRIFFYFILITLLLSFQAKSQINTDSLKFTITNIGQSINTPYDEYAPIISADGSMMIFTSSRPIYKADIDKKMQGMENVYVSYYDDMSWKWSEAKLLGPTINQPWKNNSAIALSNDGQRMLLYRGDPDGNIYESDLVGEEWSEPVKLPKPINSSSHESSASISPDGRTIYFISNRRGGQGKLDIWVCHQDNMGWGKAENLGSAINTSEDEEGVFIHPDGKTLFFSSKGHNSMGGYDIYKTVLDEGVWSTPINMGDSINTPKDDLFFSLTANGKTGYYSSTRPGGMGQKDIYEINFKNKKQSKKIALAKNNVTNDPAAADEEITNSDKDQPNLTLFKGIVIDYDSFEPLGSEIEITDNDKNQVIATIKSNSASGKFLASLPAGKNYGLTINKKGYLFYSENFNIPASAAYKEIHKHIPLQKLTIGSKIVLKNIFYDFGKATLRPESISELFRVVKLLNLSTDIKIEVASFTDSKGSAEFNLALSQARAQAVADFLFAGGIGKEQMVVKGYGKANPIATNETEEGRQLNRRTEIKVLEQ
jgi:outer membrane protein OmpA-like peptidoglycan-associated protein